MKSPFLLAEAIERSLLRRSFLIAFGFYASVTVLLFVGGRYRSEPAATLVNQAPMLEAELVKETETPRLHQASSAPAPSVRPEATISTKLNRGKESRETLEHIVDSKNQTAPAPPPGPPTHGPIVGYSPPPKIPEYLKNEVFKTSVLIEFFVPAKGACRPTLIGSSGNEELDAIALQAARTWVFQPAERDGQATDSKVRLRINFQVE